MPITLSTVLISIDRFQSKNAVNASLVNEFHQWMRNDQKSESYQKNNLKALLKFANWLFEQDDTELPSMALTIERDILYYSDGKQTLYYLLLLVVVMYGSVLSCQELKQNSPSI